MSQEFSAEDVQAHNTKKDLYIIVHNKVYNSTSFADEHPGGEEVLLDVAGQDATEAFEDVGHSDEAREVLEGLLVGKLKGGVTESAPAKGATDYVSAGPAKTDSGSSSSLALYVALLLGTLLAYGAYMVMQK